MIETMLTTVDNPHDPFTEFIEWFDWDRRMNYHTPSLLGRVSFSSEELSEADQDAAIEEAIDIIVRENVSGVHRKVTREVPDDGRPFPKT
jgi:hypothetical protein